MQMQPAATTMSVMMSIIGEVAFRDRFLGIVQGMVGADHCTVFVSNETGVRTLVAEAHKQASAQRVRELAVSAEAGGGRRVYASFYRKRGNHAFLRMIWTDS